jgi:hypothetical protein
MWCLGVQGSSTGDEEEDSVDDKEEIRRRLSHAPKRKDKDLSPQELSQKALLCQKFDEEMTKWEVHFSFVFTDQL